MGVCLRLQRLGAKRQPSYRVVAVMAKQANKGRCLENLGLYNPRTEPATIRVKPERVEHWLKQGARPSETVKQIIDEMRRREKNLAKS